MMDESFWLKAGAGQKRWACCMQAQLQAGTDI
jgi:hypothetical protein